MVEILFPPEPEDTDELTIEDMQSLAYWYEGHKDTIALDTVSENALNFAKWLIAHNYLTDVE